MKIVKVASNYGALDKNDGVELAPDAIIKELDDIYLNESFKKNDFEIIDISKRSLEDGNNIIENYDGDVFIGGDHSISYHAFKGFSKKYRNPGLIVFDAHPDVYEMFDFPSHQDWLRWLVKDKIVRKENIILVGLRNMDGKEFEYLKDNNIKFFHIKNLADNKEEVCNAIMEIARGFDGLYLSIDIDVIDPAYAPGTGYIEPGGISSRELLYFLHRLKMLKNLTRTDIVEVNPKKDWNNMTAKLAAKIIAELM